MVKVECYDRCYFIKTVKHNISGVNLSSYYHSVHNIVSTLYSLCTAPSGSDHHTIAYFNPGPEL